MRLPMQDLLYQRLRRTQNWTHLLLLTRRLQLFSTTQQDEINTQTQNATIQTKLQFFHLLQSVTGFVIVCHEHMSLRPFPQYFSLQLQKLTHTPKGRGYSGFQVTRMIKRGKKIKNPNNPWTKNYLQNPWQSSYCFEYPKNPT